MSETPSNNPIDPDKIKQAAEKAYSDAPQEIKQAVTKSQSFYQENKDAIHVIVGIAILLRINKRMVKKATETAIDNAMATIPVTIDVARYMKDYENWYHDAKNFAKEW